MNTTRIYLDSALGHKRFRQTKRAHKVRCLVVCAIQLDESGDFIADQMQAAFLAELHELEQRGPGIAARERIVGVAHQNCFDA